MAKRLLAIFAAVMMMFTMAITVSAANGEILLNGGFEETGTGWSLPAEAVYAEADEAYEGESALKIESDGNAFADQMVTLLPGGEYTITMYARGENTEKAHMKLQYQTATGAWSATPFEGGWPVSPDWKKITQKVVVPDDCIKAAVMIRLIGGGKIWYDNVSIQGPIPEPAEIQKRIDAANEAARKKAEEAAKRAARIPSVTIEETLPEDGSYPIVVNGGFEAGTKGWSCPQECERVGKIDDPDNAYEGAAAMKIDHQDNCFFTQVIKLVGGENYTLSFFAKSGGNQVRGVVKLQVYAGGVLTAEMSEGWDVGSNWQKYTWNFTAPEGATSSDLMMRLIGGGIIYYDNIVLEGPVSDEVEAVYDELINGKKQEGGNVDHVLMPAIGEPNLIKGDPTMETLDAEGHPEGVEVYGTWGQNASVTDDAHSGKNAMKVESYSGGYPWMRMQAPDLIGGATYQLTFWYKAQNVSNDKTINVKFEGYTDNTARSDNGVLGYDTFALEDTTEWKQFVYTIQIPDNCGMLLMYPRVYASIGTLVVDDMALYCVKMPTMTFDTDLVFYYEDLEQGVAKSILAPANKHTEYTCDFQLYDGETLLAEALNVPYNADNEAGFVFSLSYFKEILKEYTLVMTGKAADGTVLETKTQPLYKIQRPSLLTKDGNFIVDGKPFYPAMLYHGGDYTTWKLASDNGINLVQVSITGGSTDAFKLQLDKMHEAGMKAAVVLYHGMRAAGDPQNIEMNKKYVAELKDHPAVFCWMTMDEPNAHYTDKEELDEIMRNGYKAIKEIDNVHPIYHCEASTDKYAWGLKYNDSMGIDPYPGSFSPYETHVADKTAYAEELASKYGKGIIQILQVFTFGHGPTATPTEEQVNSMMHQSVMGGADANGYYPWIMDSPQIDGPSLDKSIYWPVVTNFASKEYDIIWKHYGKHFDTKWFSKVREDGYWIDMWVDGTDVYTIVLNRQPNEQVISVSTLSQNGKVNLGDVTITAVNGEATVTKTATGFDVKMPTGSARLFKLTPAAAVDFTNVNVFGDIDNYAWAADAINAMYAAGIANDKGDYIYEPATPITRGDFAMYLIKALGLDKTTLTNDSFNDVDADSEYALALAIGKKLGILKGVGDNNYNPEAPITRQDLMVICARGMRVAKAMADGDLAILDSFSDKALIADYATADIAAMVRDGIVKGNADGTVNPLGNTTRAEAAIIMQRITAWK